MIKIMDDQLPNLEAAGLVFQTDSAVADSVIRSRNGIELGVANDGCTLISLYNALRLCGYTKSFEEYGEALADGECFDSSGQINWLNLNKLELNLQFIWMQDNEIPNCEKVNIERLKGCGLDSDNFAILKVQSLNGVDRRHFMLFIEFTNESAICLESSGKSGKVEIRTIPQEEILGIRYLKRSLQLN